MRPAILFLDIYQDDDFVKSLRFTDADGEAVDITDWAFAAQMRTEPGAGGALVETFTVTKTDALEGRVDVSLTDAETLAIDEGTYVWDFERTLDGNTRTLLAGKVTVRADVTR